MVAAASKVDMEIEFAAIPVMNEAYDMYEAEAIAGGLWTNKEYVSPRVSAAGLAEDQEGILYDPQTSGGLLISVSREKAGELLDKLRKAGISHSAVVGGVTKHHRGRIAVESN